MAGDDQGGPGPGGYDLPKHDTASVVSVLLQAAARDGVGFRALTAEEVSALVHAVGCMARDLERVSGFAQAMGRALYAAGLRVDPEPEPPALVVVDEAAAQRRGADVERLSALVATFEQALVNSGQVMARRDIGGVTLVPGDADAGGESAS